MNDKQLVGIQHTVDSLKRSIAFKDIEIKKLKESKQPDESAAMKELRHQLRAKEQCVRSLCMDSAEEESLLEKHGVVMHDEYSNIGIVAGIQQLVDKYEAKLATAELIKVPDNLAHKIRDYMQPEEFPGPYVVKKLSLQYVLEDDAGNILARDSATDSHLQLAADCMNFVASLVKN